MERREFLTYSAAASTILLLEPSKAWSAAHEQYMTIDQIRVLERTANDLLIEGLQDFANQIAQANIRANKVAAMEVECKHVLEAMALIAAGGSSPNPKAQAALGIAPEKNTVLFAVNQDLAEVKNALMASGLDREAFDMPIIKANLSLASGVEWKDLHRPLEICIRNLQTRGQLFDS